MNRRKRMLDGLDQEIRDHIQRDVEENLDRGMSPEEARRAALRKFGNVARVKEDTRDVWTAVWLEQFLRDIRYALRMLRKSPGFSAVAVLTLALGIGANTAIFTFIDALYLKPLPVARAQQLMHIYGAVPSRSYDGGFSDPEFRLLRDHASSFSALAAETQIAQLHVVTSGGHLNGGGSPHEAKQVFVEFGDRNRVAADIVGFDADAAGQDATLRGMELAVRQGFTVQVVSLPPGPDPADDPAAFEERLKAPVSYPVHRVRLEHARSPDRATAFAAIRAFLSETRAVAS